jgi:Ca2+-binding RTX toxin-like protein
MIERCEPRRLFASVFAAGTLTVTGTDGSNAIDVRFDQNKVVASVNGVVEGGWRRDRIRRVVIDAGSGNDYVNVNLDYALSALIRGGAGNDTVVATMGARGALYGGGGRDKLVSFAGPETQLFGGANSDTLLAGGGNDSIFGEGGNDRLVASGGAVWLSGGAGTDTIAFNAPSDGFAHVRASLNGMLQSIIYTPESVQLPPGAAAATTISFTPVWFAIASDVEIVIGTAGPDDITGSASNNTIFGGGGADTLNGGDGTDAADDDPLDTRTSIETLL